MIKLFMEIKEGEPLPKNFTGRMEFPDGEIQYLKNGLLHREDGPAFINSRGTKKWFYEGKYHRLDGPAYESYKGIKEYWIHGKCFSEAEFNKKIQEMNSPSCDNKIVEIDGKKYKLTLVE